MWCGASKGAPQIEDGNSGLSDPFRVACLCGRFPGLRRAGDPGLWSFGVTESAGGSKMEDSGLSDPFRVACLCGRFPRVRPLRGRPWAVECNPFGVTDVSARSKDERKIEDGRLGIVRPFQGRVLVWSVSQGSATARATLGCGVQPLRGNGRVGTVKGRAKDRRWKTRDCPTLSGSRACVVGSRDS